MSDRIFQLLLVEDSQSDVRLFKEALRGWKTRHCLYVADDGEEALDLLHNRGNYDGAPRPDLIFLDLNMPKMDGFQVLRCIREDDNPVIRSIPILVLSTSSAPQDVAKAYEFGATAFLVKPNGLEDFFLVMASVNSFWFGTAAVPPPSLPPTCEANAL